MIPSDEIERLVRAAGPRQAASDDRRRRVLSRAREEWESIHLRRARRRRTGLGVLALAAAVVLAIRLWPGDSTAVPEPAGDVAALMKASGPVALMDGSVASELMPGARLAAGARVRTGSSTVAGLALDGDVSLRLDRDTIIRLRGADAVELERGAVYLDTGRSQAAPRAMSVITSIGTLRDVGTQFEVRLLEDRVQLRVRKGAVIFERGRLSRQAAQGTELIARSDGEPSLRPFAAFGAEWAWVGRAAAPFNLGESTLRQFLDWFERETGYKTRFAPADISESASTIRLQGSIADMSPEEALDVVLPAVGLDYRLDNGALVLQRAGGVR
jgi:ferric-dicitrate binding protein FerR (iron transport regulator)